MLTALAFLLVFVALVVPNHLDAIGPSSFARIPLEGLIIVGVLLVLPVRPRRVVAVIVGVVLGLLTILKLFDMGFWAVLHRQFDLVADWGLLDDAGSFLVDSIGRLAAIGSVALAAALAVAVVVLLAFAVRRVSDVTVRHKQVATRSLTVLAAAWVASALVGTQLAPLARVASRSEAEFVVGRAQQVHAGLTDRQTFAAQIAVDAFRDTPGSQLLTGLRGKDVIVSFVESYGRSALQDPQMAAALAPVLDSARQQLAAAGFAARSAYLTSPTFGGSSWLAHSTLQTGLWIDTQQRHRTIVATNRLTLTGAFRRAGWRTIGVEPANTYAWPEGDFYGFDQVYDARNLGYRGPAFSWSTMPDQYALAAFQRLAYAVPREAPLMAEITLTSSHTPWTPTPRLLDWNDVGDGAAYAAQVKQGDSPDVVWRSAARVRAEYIRSVAYSVGSLLSYVQRYGDKNLVLVFLGDHQPSTIVSGSKADHDVPVTIIAHDSAVLDRIAGWGWQDGLKPDPHAPVWRMDAFRDKFLTAFGPTA